MDLTLSTDFFLLYKGGDGYLIPTSVSLSQDWMLFNLEPVICHLLCYRKELMVFIHAVNSLEGGLILM